MNIAIVGAGFSGIATACELASDGHAVTVFERRAAAAEEASFGHAGLVAPGCAWARLGSEAIPLRESGLVPSGWAWHRQQRAARADGEGDAERLALAALSQERLRIVAGALELHYQKAEGVLVLVRNEKDRRRLAPLWDRLREARRAANEAPPETIRTLEPGLNADTPLSAAIHLPGDGVGNCRQFALLLRAEAERHGVVFAFNTTVARVAGGMPPTLVLEGEATPRAFDAVVLCAGMGAPALLQGLGPRRLPFDTLHGYSLSAAIREPLHAPYSAVVDAATGASIVRLGDRIRVAGATHIGTMNESRRQTAMQSLYQALHRWFPGAARLSTGVQGWHGERLVLPDERPLLGPSGSPGVWLHLASGGHGWTFASGSARLLADAIGGQAPALPLAPYSIARFD